MPQFKIQGQFAAGHSNGSACFDARADGQEHLAHVLVDGHIFIVLKDEGLGIVDLVSGENHRSR